jgi:hypothetical protein
MKHFDSEIHPCFNGMFFLRWWWIHMWSWRICQGCIKGLYQPFVGAWMHTSKVIMDDKGTFFPIWMSQVPNPKIKYEIKCSMVFLIDSMNFFVLLSDWLIV